MSQKAEDVAEQQVSEILDSIEAEVENVSEKVLVQVENATRATMEAEIQTAASKRALDELSNIEVSMRRNLSEIDAAFVEIEKNNKQLLQNGEVFRSEMVEIKLASEKLGKKLSEFEDEMSKMDSDLDGLTAQVQAAGEEGVVRAYIANLKAGFDEDKVRSAKAFLDSQSYNEYFDIIYPVLLETIEQDNNKDLKLLCAKALKKYVSHTSPDAKDRMLKLIRTDERIELKACLISCLSMIPNSMINYFEETESLFSEISAESYWQLKRLDEDKVKSTRKIEFPSIQESLRCFENLGSEGAPLVPFLLILFKDDDTPALLRLRILNAFEYNPIEGDLVLPIIIHYIESQNRIDARQLGCKTSLVQTVRTIGAYESAGKIYADKIIQLGEEKEFGEIVI